MSLLSKNAQWGTGSPLPLGERSARERRVRGPLANSVHGQGPLTRPKRVDLSPRGRGGREGHYGATTSPRPTSWLDRLTMRSPHDLPEDLFPIDLPADLTPNDPPVDLILSDPPLDLILSLSKDEVVTQQHESEARNDH
jgi:hypothetical protein